MAAIFELTRKSTLALRHRKAALLRQLHLPHDVLRVSRVEQFLTCGKASCACHQGKKHGPYYYLTLGLAAGKIRKFLLKEPGQREQARAGTAAYAQFMAGVEELSQINAELLRRGDRSTTRSSVVPPSAWTRRTGAKTRRGWPNNSRPTSGSKASRSTACSSSALTPMNILPASAAPVPAAASARSR